MGFSFRGFLYFDGIGGVGYSVGRWQPDDAAEHLSWAARFHSWTEGLRRTISDRITEVVPGPDGTVTAALISGEQSAIPEDLQEAYRVSGIAHHLSISGVHMSLLAGVVFFTIRCLVALIPFIALRIDSKKIAAVVGLIATLFYLVISGMSVPAVRSFLMIAVVMMAILMDRTALSVRTIGWAALIVMAIYPDAVIGASFEMSFLAVLALVALYEQTWLRVVWRGADGKFQIFRAAGLYLVGLVVTDFVAGGATSLFAAYHFNRLPTYSAVTNLAAVPLTGIWIMPTAILGLILMPFGWDAVPLKIMGAGVTLLDDIAREVATWHGAQIHVPPMRPWIMALVSLGIIFICLWRGRERWLGFVVVLPAMLQPYLTAPPDVLVDDSARVFAVTDDRGKLVFKPGRTGRFVREAWDDRFKTSTIAWPSAGNTESTLGLACDADGCILAREGRKVLLAFNAAALAEDCGDVDMIVSVTAARDLCPNGPSLDIIDLHREGAYALWLTKDGIRKRSVADSTGNRIWKRGILNEDETAPDDLEP
jgi:competence protein ComEC